MSLKRKRKDLSLADRYEAVKLLKKNLFHKQKSQRNLAVLDPRLLRFPKTVMPFKPSLKAVQILS
jgi:hypothetical protein